MYDPFTYRGKTSEKRMLTNNETLVKGLYHIEKVYYTYINTKVYLTNLFFLTYLNIKEIFTFLTRLR